MEEAERIGRRMVEEGLVACVNLLQGRSIYKWKGAVEDTPEILMIAKTAKESTGRVMEFITKNHPYETPEILSLDIDGVNEDYKRWVLSSLTH
jgi:periplasmic divalent cation tolerance protein